MTPEGHPNASHLVTRIGVVFESTLRNFSCEINVPEDANRASLDRQVSRSIGTRFTFPRKLLLFGDDSKADGLIIAGGCSQVLLELSDAELEAGLGVTHPLHRKKLRLAIEEHRHPGHVRYPCIAQLGHTWVSSEWLPDLGLAQYSESFATNMVDARMLDHLSKKELEKLLGVTRKFHQASIVHGIHLLRMLNYDRQVRRVEIFQLFNLGSCCALIS